jgi:hypothetical protein
MQNSCYALKWSRFVFIHLAGKVCSWLLARCKMRKCGCPTRTGMHWSVRRLLLRYSSCSMLRLSSPVHAEGKDSRLFADAFKYLRLRNTQIYHASSACSAAIPSSQMQNHFFQVVFCESTQPKVPFTRLMQVK